MSISRLVMTAAGSVTVECWENDSQLNSKSFPSLRSIRNTLLKPESWTLRDIHSIPDECSGMPGGIYN